MAFRTKKISQMDPKGANLASTDLLEISELVSGSYVTKSITGAEIVASVPPSVTAWGTITGTLSSQTDLQTALNGKVTGNTAITGATKTKVTYDSKGLVTAGADATTADIADSLNKRYVTDANLTTIGNTSGVNTGDQTLSGLGGVPTTRTLTINGTTQDLSADRTFTISTGITIGTTAITSGTVGRVLFEGTGNVVQESGNLFWDNTNGRLGIGTATPQNTIDIAGTGRIVTTGNYALTLTRSSTSGVAQQIFNNFGTTYIGSDNSVGGFLFTGGLPYASFFGSGANYPTQFGSNSIVRMTIFAGGNIGINTTTDAGFKLDVNGTARVQDTLTLSNQNGNTSVYSIKSSGNDLSIAALYLRLRSPTDGNRSLLGFGWDGSKGYAYTERGLVVNAITFPVASAIMEVNSTTQGFLPPRMTTTQKNAIASPATGLMVYDTTLNLMALYNGTIWTTL